MSGSDTVERFSGQFAAAEAHLPGTAWVAGFRREGLARFQALGLPTSRHEEWKYTRLSTLERKSFGIETPIVPMPDLTNHLIDGPVHRLVFIDGRLSDEHSHLGTLPQGARVRGLAEALADGDVRVHEALGDITGEEDAFTALNAAFMSGGVVIELDARCVVEAPLQVIHVATGADDFVSHSCSLVLAGVQSQATLLESFVGPDGGSYFNNARMELRLADGARINHIRVQDESLAAFHIARVRASVGRDAHYRSQVFSFGAALCRVDIDVRLAATGAECDLDGLYLVKGRQHVDHHTRIDHAKPHGRSSEYYKGIVDDSARAVFNGKVYVHVDAQKTDATQANHNLLLSRRAEVDTKPQLEIYADDVKCAHGATVGQLDPKEMFYLRSRGLDEVEARNLLIYGFANEVVDRIKLDALRGYVYRRLAVHLPRRTAADGES